MRQKKKKIWDSVNCIPLRIFSNGCLHGELPALPILQITFNQHISWVPFDRLTEFDDQVHWVREGMARVIPVPLLSLFTGSELETMVSLCTESFCRLL